MQYFNKNRLVLLTISMELLYSGSTSTIESLFKAGMNMSMRFDDGQTPIHMAAELGK